MNILAIDTTTKTASVSVKYQDKLFMDKITNEVTHSEKLLPLVDKMLNLSNATLKDIQMLACINGPGSFTGIRIGLATAKAFSQVNNLDIFSINSLELIAYCTVTKKELTGTNYVISVISTNNDRVYYCIYKLDRINDKIQIDALTKIQNDYIDEAVENIQNYLTDNRISANLYVSGNCINQFKEDILSLNCNTFDFYPDTNDCINIYSYIDDISKYTFNAYTLKATYARPSQAERMQNGKN